MSDEHIPCRTKALPDGQLKIIPLREVRLRPGESATFSLYSLEVIVHRVWFGRRWWVATRAYVQGLRDANLELEERPETYSKES
jgi:hypothetical protein